MFSKRKQTHSGPIAYYEFKIKEIKAYPSQRVIITQQNLQSYSALRISTANSGSKSNRNIKIKPLLNNKKEEPLQQESNYNSLYKNVFHQRNLLRLIGGKGKQQQQ